MSKTANKCSPEVRARAVRVALDGDGQHGSRWQAITSIAAKIGGSANMMNVWVKKAEVDSGKCAGVPSDMAEKLKALEREDRELRQANEILRKVSAYFAIPLAHAAHVLPGSGTELDRRSKQWRIS